MVEWRVDELKRSGVEVAFRWCNWVFVLKFNPSDVEVVDLVWLTCCSFFCGIFLLVDTSYCDDDAVFAFRLNLDRVPVER